MNHTLKIVLSVAIIGLWSCAKKSNSSQLSKEESAEFQQKGQQIVMAARSALGGKLISALNTGGPTGAISFCSIEAIPITDSVATAHMVFLKRITDRPRNPGNRANTSELKMIDSLKTLLAKGEPLKPVVLRNRNNEIVMAYYPILTEPMCLQCHGNREKDMHPKTLAELQSAYPADEATEYTAGALRGLWAVGLKRQKK